MQSIENKAEVKEKRECRGPAFRERFTKRERRKKRSPVVDGRKWEESPLFRGAVGRRVV